MTTLLVTHSACLDHHTPSGHPERPDRLRAVDQALEAEAFQALAREKAPLGEWDTISLCHPMDYIEAIKDAAPARLHPGSADHLSRSRRAYARPAGEFESGRSRFHLGDAEADADRRRELQ